MAWRTVSVGMVLGREVSTVFDWVEVRLRRVVPETVE
jgi:hypothetical protein